MYAYPHMDHSYCTYVCSVCMHHGLLPSLNQYSTCTPNTDLCSCPFSIRVLPEGEHLPQRDSVAPHITGAGECAVVDGLWSIPCNVDREGYRYAARQYTYQYCTMHNTLQCICTYICSYIQQQLTSKLCMCVPTYWIHSRNYVSTQQKLHQQVTAKNTSSGPDSVTLIWPHTYICKTCNSPPSSPCWSRHSPLDRPLPSL